MTALASVRGMIPGHLAIEVGLGAACDSGAADVGLHCEFTDRAALGPYLTPSPHLAVKDAIAPHGAPRRRPGGTILRAPRREGLSR